MKITNEQLILLDSFCCERIRNNQVNEELAKQFHNPRGQGLIDDLLSFGIKQDISGEAAFYIIKRDNKPFLFFSIKCGSLFLPISEEELRNEEQSYSEKLDLLSGNAANVSNPDEILETLERVRLERNITVEQQQSDYLSRRKRANYKRAVLKQEESVEQNNNIQRVSYTYPGVELIHFCSNEDAKDEWNGFGFNKTMGEVLFWKFIAPMVIEVQQIIGCQYLFLFAADSSEDGTLINYYKVSLCFSEKKEIGTNKPFYDYCCPFLCQSIKDMKNNMEEYFNNFNVDSVEDIV